MGGMCGRSVAEWETATDFRESETFFTKVRRYKPQNVRVQM